MIKSVHFKNFKALRDATLPLGRFTLIVGPNGSGKSTALQALRSVRKPKAVSFAGIASAAIPAEPESGLRVVRVLVEWDELEGSAITEAHWTLDSWGGPVHQTPDGSGVPDTLRDELNARLGRVRVYTLDAAAIARPAALQPDTELGEDGSYLVTVLDQLRDRVPERFEALNAELSEWLPEFDRILFDTPSQGQRSLSLRLKQTQHRVAAPQLSQGTLVALAVLTLAYLPTPPSIACFEEPDRAMHPRLLRRVQDALYRLAYPTDYGEDRPPVQVIATTHNPYFLDLFRDRPEEVVIAEKNGLEASFHRLADLPHMDEILEGASLGDVWYTGILGGVPAEV